MANVINGRVIALSGIKEVASSDPQKPAIKKRELYMDCTRYDPYTGERSEYENKPLLEFGGDKVLNKIESLGLQQNDIVAVKFEVQGTPYKDKTTGKTKVFTSIRCYDIEVVRRAGQAVQQPQQQAAPVQQPAPQPAAPAPLPTHAQVAEAQSKEPLPF